MKAYKLIFELLKHPFSDVTLISTYILTNVRYNNYDKKFLLESIKDSKEDNYELPVSYITDERECENFSKE